MAHLTGIIETLVRLDDIVKAVAIEVGGDFNRLRYPGGIGPFVVPAMQGRIVGILAPVLLARRRKLIIEQAAEG